MDEESQMILDLLNLPTYDLSLERVPVEDLKSACPLELIYAIDRIYRTIDIESLHREHKICLVELPAGLQDLLVPREGDYLLVGPFMLQEYDELVLRQQLLSNGISATFDILLYMRSIVHISQHQLDLLIRYFTQYVSGTFERVRTLSEDTGIEYFSSLFAIQNTAELSKICRDFCLQVSERFSSAAWKDISAWTEDWEGQILHYRDDEQTVTVVREYAMIESDMICSQLYRKTPNHDNELNFLFNRKRLENCKGLRLLLECHRKMLFDLKNIQIRDESNKYGTIVGATMQKIRADYRQPILLKDLAESVNVHPNYLSGLFRSKTGQTISQYITSVRLACACSLLRNSSSSISRISEECGFLDPSYFSRIFLKTCHVTPRQYREQAAPEAQEDGNR